MAVSTQAQQQSGPVAVVDVHYDGDSATAACVVAAFWTDESPVEERVVRVSNVRPYKPGAFFERELPCILPVLSLVQTTYRTIVIDGYVDLDERGTPGLGGHLHDHFGGTVAVVGVAKTTYRGSLFAAHVLRGVSHRPLLVTARGLVSEEAAELVQRMHGGHRIPTLLKRVDGLARGLVSPLPTTEGSLPSKGSPEGKPSSGL